MKLLLLPIIFSVTLLQACSNNYIELSDIEDIEINDNLNIIISSNKHLYQLIYEVSGEKYTYSTYEIKDKYKFLQISTKGDDINSISLITLHEAYWPSIRDCTLFPYHENVDSEGCLRDFNSNIETMSSLQWKKEILATNQSLKETQKNETIGAYLMTGIVAVLTAPIIIPVAVIATPLASTADSYSEREKDLFNIQLGETISDKLISSIDQKYVSLINSTGTVFIYGNIFFGEETLAFGTFDSKVIWVQREPKWVCGGGFMYWGQLCVMGNHNDKHL